MRILLRKGIVHLLPTARAGRMVFFLLFGLGTFLRLAGLAWGISPDGHYSPPMHDEVHAQYFLVLPWEQFTKDFGDYEMVQGVFPVRLFSHAVSVIGNQFGWNAEGNRVFEYAVPRLFTSLFGIAGLIAIYALGRRLGGERVGLGAMALLAVAPGHWYYSQVIKGEIGVATLVTVVVIALSALLERGIRPAALWAGAATGLAIALKFSAFPLLPLLLLGHVAAAVKHRAPLRMARLLVGSLSIAGMVFLVLFPYPFVNRDKWWELQLHPPNHQTTVRPPTPQLLADVWRSYNTPQRPQVELVVGEAARRVLPLAGVVAMLSLLWNWRTPHGRALAVTLIVGGTLYYSLSFFPPLSDRYLIPLAPFGLVLIALVAFGADRLRLARPVQLVSGGIGLLVLLSTAAVTVVLYPGFAWADVRQETAQFLETEIPKNEFVGEFEPGGRQSLPINTSRVMLGPLRSAGREIAHIYLGTNPRYLIVQREPDTHDQDFRRQLYTPEIRTEFETFLRGYRQVRTFGHEPRAFGRLLPTKISHPLYDLYEKKEDAPVSAGDRAIDEQIPLPISAPVMSRRTWKAEDIVHQRLTATIDLSSLHAAWERGEEVRGSAALLLQFDETSAGAPVLSDTTDISLETPEGWWMIVVPLRPEHLKDARTMSIAVLFRPDASIDVYAGTEGRLIARTQASQTFQAVRPGVAVWLSEPHGLPLTLSSFRFEALPFSVP